MYEKARNTVGTDFPLVQSAVHNFINDFSVSFRELAISIIVISYPDARFSSLLLYFSCGTRGTVSGILTTQLHLSDHRPYLLTLYVFLLTHAKGGFILNVFASFNAGLGRAEENY